MRLVHAIDTNIVCIARPNAISDAVSAAFAVIPQRHGYISLPWLVYTALMSRLVVKTALYSFMCLCVQGYPWPHSLYDDPAISETFVGLSTHYKYPRRRSGDIHTTPDLKIPKAIQSD